VESDAPLVVMKGNKAFVVIISAEKFKELTGKEIVVGLPTTKSKK